MDEGEFRRVAGSLRRFHRQFASLFGREETRRRSGQYLRGLLVQQTDRRNAENLAEAVDGATPRGLQRFLTEAPWDPAPVVAALQGYLGERLLPHEPGEGTLADTAFLLDDTGFAKQGTRSVGVARQYSGTLGKVGNCQIGVFLGYVSPRGHALVDGTLYLPQRWTQDPDRCRRAGVPEAVLAPGYQSKAALALALLRRAVARGTLVAQWVVADAGFGELPSFRDALDDDGWAYLLAVPRTTPVFPKPPRTTKVTLTAGTPPRRVEVLPAAQTVQALAAALPARQWRRLTVADGAQGPRTHQFAALRVWESRDGRPGRRTWLLLRRDLDGSDLTYCFSNAPPETPLRRLARTSALRWPIETEFQHGKAEVGLDEYEVRSWRGWHHHMTMALLAGAFLLTLEQDWGGKEPRRHPAAGHLRPAPGAPPPSLDPPRPGPVAGHHPPPQRLREGLPCQTPSAHAP